LLSSGWSLEAEPAVEPSCMAHLDQLAAGIDRMDLAPVRSAIAHAVRLLRGAGLTLTDRRIVRVQRLMAAAAALAGREQPTGADLWPIVFALPTQHAQDLGRDVLRDFLAESENSALLSAPAEGSLGPLARGARILREGSAIVDDVPPDDGAREMWRLRLEGIARDIDATFAREALPPELAALRRRIVDILAPAATPRGDA